MFNVQIKRTPHTGLGLFAKSPLQMNTVIWHNVEILTPEYLWCADEIREAPIELQRKIIDYAFQVGNVLWAGIHHQRYDVADSMFFINHSCNPNAYFSSVCTVSTFKEIDIDEEITIDYATIDSFDWGSVSYFECKCLSPNCRLIIGPNDWKIPEVQKKEQGHFVPYLQTKIDFES
jgi:uncharacterized protein